MPVEVGQIVYRAEVEGKAIVCDEFKITKVTPGGFWYDYFGQERWSPMDGRKVSHTVEAAHQRLRARKRSYLRRARLQLDHAEKQYEVAFGKAPEPRKMLRMGSGFFDLGEDR